MRLLHKNHGFGVVAEDIEQSDKVEITHINLNDNSIEGIRVNGKNAFSVQYHPESSPGTLIHAIYLMISLS